MQQCDRNNTLEKQTESSFLFAKKHGFRPLALEDGPLFERHVNCMKGLLSSYTCFSSMMMWEERYRVFLKREGSYLLLLLKGGFDDNWEVIPPLGPYDEEHFFELNSVWRKLIQMLEAEGMELFVTEITEWMFPWLERMKLDFKLTCDRDFSDYIYEAGAFQSALEEPGTRYNIRYFLRKQEPEFRKLQAEDYPLYETVIRKAFCEYHTCEECESGCQIKALRCMVTHHEQLGVKGGLVLAEGSPVGYVGVARVGNTLIYQAFKQVRGIRGLAEWLRKTAWECWGKGVKWINYTEDMGLSGLRRHKQNLCAYRLSHNYYGRISAL